MSTASTFSRRRLLSNFFGSENSPAETSAEDTNVQEEAVATASAGPKATGFPDLPPFEVIAMTRMAYGPRPGDLDRVRTMGLTTYVDEQLTPNDNDDPDALTRLNNQVMRINYSADPDGAYPALDELRALETRTQGLTDFWPLGLQANNIAFQERIRPLEEIRNETFLRAVYSKWQLREVMVEFWHAHFNVDAQRVDSRIYATWPLYDRIMRANWNGNFRVFLEEITKSIAMMYYLNLVSNRNTGPNENYARELQELHTLGAENYYTDPATARFPPGTTATGYTEADVKEISKALTGWSIESGQRVNASLTLPSTGLFRFVTQWNDTGVRKILNQTVPSPTTDPMSQGKRVLDLLAGHPNVAKYVVTKLCRRLIGDNPPTSVIKKAVAVWLQNVNAPDQLKRVIRVILLSPEFTATFGQKTKRPFEYAVSFLRATEANLSNTGGGYTYYSLVGEAGQPLFLWPSPNGYPDVQGFWLNTNSLRASWRNVTAALAGSYSTVTFNLRSQIPVNVTTSNQIVDFFINRLLGRTVTSDIRTNLVDYLRNGAAADAVPPGTTAEVTTRINRLVGRICVLPDFWWR